MGNRKGRDAKTDVWDRNGLVLAATAYATNADLIFAAHRLGHLQKGWLTPDATYGKGVFWRRFRPDRLTTNDLYEPGADHHYDFRWLPDDWQDLYDATVFDPPYGLRGTVGTNNGGYGLDGGYLSVEDRHLLILDGIRECALVTRPGGLVLVKCQDQVALGRLHFQTFEFVAEAVDCGLTLVEKLDMLPKTKGGRTGPARPARARRTTGAAGCRQPSSTPGAARAACSYSEGRATVPDDTTDLLIELHGLWDADYEDTKIATEWADDAKAWEVRLSVASEYYNPHEADRAEYTWIFPGDTLAEALQMAAEWCRELEKLRRCSECDGQGWYWTEGKVQAICEPCDGTGLAHPPVGVAGGG